MVSETLPTPVCIIQDSGRSHTVPITGAAAAYFSLAYDLYALDHNAELQQELIRRLRNHDKFTGARYEVYVAATFLRAGFEISFEDESDRRSTHCEFTARHPRTGRSFSVEAKRTEANRFRGGRLFINALSKQAKHDRVVFLDSNVRDDAGEDSAPAFLESARRKLKRFENRKINGQPLPPAYIFLTNIPWPYDLDGPAQRFSALVDGFQIPEFATGVLRTLRQAIEARDRHIEMHDLMESMKDQIEIPATFDGQIPEYAFNPELPRILIGQHIW